MRGLTRSFFVKIGQCGQKLYLKKQRWEEKEKGPVIFFSNLSDIFFRFTLFNVSLFWLTNPTNFGSFPLYLPLSNWNNSNKKQTCSQVACTYKLLIEYTNFRRKSGLLTKRIKRKTKRFWRKIFSPSERYCSPKLM